VGLDAIDDGGTAADLGQCVAVGVVERAGQPDRAAGFGGQEKVGLHRYPAGEDGRAGRVDAAERARRRPAAVVLDGDVAVNGQRGGHEKARIV